MSDQSRRERRRPRYNHCDSPVIAAVTAIAREYHCMVRESGETVTIRHNGITAHLGTFDDIKNMTVRGLLSWFEELTQDWRYESEGEGRDKETR